MSKENNTGSCNTGNLNTGNLNTGNRNTGYRNTGNRNTGNLNTGDWNTGDWNKCDFETGFFNSKTPDTVNVFNKPCLRKAFENARKPNLINFTPNIWIYSAEMSADEKKTNPQHETTGGYLKCLKPEEAWQLSWFNAPDADKKLLYALPNFDPKVFKEISGIDVTLDKTWTKVKGSSKKTKSGGNK